MKKKGLSISKIYRKGRENLEKAGVTWTTPPDSNIGASVRVNRKYLDSLFFEPKFMDPVAVDISCSLFGKTLTAPIFCSPISRADFLRETVVSEIASGVSKAGVLMMLGIGGAQELQRCIDTGASVAKIVKPYKTTDLIYKKIRDAEIRGCVAVGMDIDHFYGRLARDEIQLTNTFGPQSLDEMKKMIRETSLPFIIKGVLSVSDAEKALELGASAIIVSNHGWASVDFTVPSMIALPRIAQRVGNKMIVLVDTAFKTGNDILKALALGAKAVGFASSMILACAADPKGGVEQFVNLLRAELERTMAATGCPNLSSVDKSIIAQMPHFPEL